MEIEKFIFLVSLTIREISNAEFIISLDLFSKPKLFNHPVFDPFDGESWKCIE